MKISHLIPPAKPTVANEDHWIPLSDLMTGLMMIFMLVAVVFLVQVEADKDQAEQKQRLMRDVAENYYDVRSQLYDDLYREFAVDLPRWKATLDRDLSI